MKKIFIILTSLIGVSIGSLYIVLFTSFGNSLSSSYIEDYLNDKGIVAFKLEKFKLTFDKVSLKATIDKNSQISLSGNYDIFSQNIDLKYLVDIKDLSKLEKFTQQKLLGSLALVGSVKGDESELFVKGKSNIFDSQAFYDMQVNNLKPKYININIQDAKIEQILTLSNQKSYATGIVDINVNIKDTNVKSLNGIVSLDVKQAHLNNKLLNTEFTQDLKRPITISGQINSKLIPNQVISKVNITSSLAKLNIEKNIINIREKTINSDYELLVNKFSDLSDFIQTKSDKGFSLNGSIQGDERNLSIKGSTNIFQGNSTYDVVFQDNKLKEALLDLKAIEVEEFLALAQQPLYLKGKTNINARIKNAKIGFLDGNIKIQTKNANLNKNVINKQYDLNLKKDINLNLDLNSVLNKNTINSSVKLKSSLLSMNISSLKLNLKNENIHSDFKLEVQNLRKLESLIGTKLNGSFNINGKISGDKKKVTIVGKSNIFDSQPNFDLTLVDLKPKTLKFNVKKAKLQKVLYTLNQENYAKGLINIDANILDLNTESLDGIVKTNITQGKLNNKTVNKLFELQLKKEVLFQSKSHSALKANDIISNIAVNSNLANFKSDKSILNIKSLSMLSDYELDVKDLGSLYDLTKTKLRGSFKLNGNIKKDQNLKVTGKSNVLKGTLDFNLYNDKLSATIKSIKTKDLLYMLYYPIVFDSSAQSTLNYNLKSQKGTVNTILENGKILENKYTSTIKSITNFDLTREAYTKSVLKSNINKKVITSTLDMDSKNTEIDVPNSIVNLNKRTITALVQTRLDDIEFDTKISGNLDKPKVKIQTDKLIKSTVKTKVYKEIEKKILKKTGSDAVKSLLKGFFQ
ncbi:hypothetical protein A9Q76_06600 [Arcobacter sp. 31_11_sub10_T18]|nr:hypothetical protein A9Q76_06600 [Arcobacter sp. 31_11_sub10_T18]